MKGQQQQSGYGEHLKEIRISAGLTLAEVAERLDIDLSQVQRRETGGRRITMDYLLKYCQVLGVDFRTVFQSYIDVPVIGVIDEVQEVYPPPAESENVVSINSFCQNPETLRALRYETRSRLERMAGHVALFHADVEGIPFGIWGKRCVMRRTNGSQRVGWLIQEEGQIHVFHPGSDVEFNIKLEWASPIIAVVTPESFRDPVPA